MKNLKIFMIILLCTSSLTISSISAQQEEITFANQYDAWVELNNKITVKGRLLGLRKDKVIIQGSDQPIVYDSNVVKMKFRKKESITKGFFIGSLTGGVLGALFGYQVGKPSDCSNCFLNLDFRKEAATAFGLSGFVGGGLIGALIGSKKVTININSDKNLTRDQIRKLHRQIY